MNVAAGRESPAATMIGKNEIWRGVGEVMSERRVRLRCGERERENVPESVRLFYLCPHRDDQNPIACHVVRAQAVQQA